MFNASTFETWGVVSRCLSWPVGLGIYRLDVCGSSLHGLEATSSPVSRVTGPSYIHRDWAIVPATRRIRGIILRVSSLIRGFVCIGVSIVSLIVWDVVVSTIPRVVGAHRTPEASVVERSWYELRSGCLSRLAALLFQDIMEQFLASSHLNSAVFKVFIGSHLGSLYYIFEDGLWEAFEKEVGYFGIAHCVTATCAE